jgi:hypothetical protein
MAGVLRADRLWVETFTGLRMRQFEDLLRVVRERGGNGPGGGRPWCLPLTDRVLPVAVYYRTNLTMRQLAPLFAVLPATVCRVIQRLRPLLDLEPISRPADTTDRLWIVDGTLIPVRDRKIGASSRNAPHQLSSGQAGDAAVASSLSLMVRPWSSFHSVRPFLLPPAKTLAALEGLSKM